MVPTAAPSTLPLQYPQFDRIGDENWQESLARWLDRAVNTVVGADPIPDYVEPEAQERLGAGLCQNFGYQDRGRGLAVTGQLIFGDGVTVRFAQPDQFQAAAAG